MLQRLSVPLLAMTLLAAACGGGEDGSPDPGSAGDETGEGHVQLSVEAFDFGFEPDSLSVDKGDAVHIAFTNTGDTPHTLSSEELGFDLRLDGGGSGEVGFVAPQEDGTYAFQCNIHPDQMQGEVIVGTGGDDRDKEDTGEGAGEKDTGVDY